MWYNKDTEREVIPMKIYLAAPFFNKEEIEHYNNIIHDLREMGHEVYVPREHEIPNAWSIPNSWWAEQVFTDDIMAIGGSELVVCLNYGMYSDSGTAWEMGYAKGLDIPIVQVLMGDENTVYSLMTINGADFITTPDILSLDRTTVNLEKVVQK